MRNQKTTITIGIPAFNEAANIQQVLKSISAQEQGQYEIIEILIVLDACTDKTEAKIEALKNEKVTTLKNRKRLGQAVSQNRILKRSKGEILILLNADVLLDTSFVSNLIRPILQNPKVGLVSGQVVPLPAHNFFEDTLNFSAELKNTMFLNHRHADTPYLCHGRGRAFSKSFVKKLRWPKLVSEDAYSYLRAKELGFGFAYQPQARLYYRSPRTFKDHLKQSARFQHSIQELTEYFPTEFVYSHYRIAPWLVITNLFRHFVKRPLSLIFFVGIFLMTSVISLFKSQTIVAWAPSPTSKKLT